MSIKFTSTVRGAALVLISLTLVSKAVGFLREVLFADYFGAGRDFEIYLVGAVLPLTINTVVYFIAQNYFIPKYNSIRSSSEGKERLFTSGIFWLFTASFLLLAVLLFFFSDIIITYYTGGLEPDNSRAAIIFKLLLISFPLNAGFSVLAGYLIAEFKYSYPAVSQILSGLIQIITVILLYNDLDIYVIPAGLLLGYFIQLLVVYYYSRKRVSLSFKTTDLTFLRTTASGSLMLFIIIIETLNQLYVLFDRYYYSQVPEGGIAALNYAATVYQLPLSIISFGLATVLFPKISEAFSRKNYAQLKNYYNKGLIYNLVIYIPVIVIMFFFGDIIIKIFFERGKFTEKNTLQSFYILQIFTVSLLFYSSYTIVNKMIFSMNLVKQLVYISVLSLISKITLNAMLVGSYGQNGLAVSTTVSYIILSIAGFFLVRMKLKSYANYMNTNSNIQQDQFSR